jgi:SAM-dependent methyltransferase
MSPVCPNFVIENKIKSLDLKNLIVVNVGSGNTFLDKEIINTDFIPYPNVDLVTDALNLPFKNNTVDAIACLSVLEHVPNPTGVVAEFQRILKPGGQIFCVIPFMQGYHASPHDYTRFTVSGMKELFKNFEIIILEPEGGPTSALLWIFQEWLATLLSFGIKKIHRILLIILMFSLWPIKFLDLIMIKYSTSNNISSLFRIIVKKK